MRGVSHPEGRPGTGLPDAIVIGTMKSGTTTLYDRLGQHPGVWGSRWKEPHYFSHQHDRGPDWYRSLFAERPAGRLVVDASPSYTAQVFAADAAARIAAELPGVPLVAVLRDPVERTRAHYLHEVRRARETRPFLEAIEDGATRYVSSSRYASCLRPYREGPLAANLLVLRTEDLDDDGAWRRVLDHLGLEPVPRPLGSRNIGGDAVPMSGLGRRLYERTELRFASRVPAPLRRLGRRAVFRSPEAVAHLVASATEPVPPAIRDDLLAQADEVATWAGIDVSGWCPAPL